MSEDTGLGIAIYITSLVLAPTVALVTGCVYQHWPQAIVGAFILGGSLVFGCFWLGAFVYDRIEQRVRREIKAGTTR